MAIYYGRDAISCHSVIAADCTNVGVTPNKGIKIRLSLGVNFRLSFRVGSNPVCNGFLGIGHERTQGRSGARRVDRL